MVRNHALIHRDTDLGSSFFFDVLAWHPGLQRSRLGWLGKRKMSLSRSLVEFLHGQLSKLGSFKKRVPYYIGRPKRDPSVENYPHVSAQPKEGC